MKKKSLEKFKQNLLSKETMRTITGGYTSCSCVGGVGSWYYTGNASPQQLSNDQRTYCSSGFANCQGN